MNTTEISVESCIDCCNGLLRGELSAVETYSQAIEKFNTGSERAVLERIRTEHSDSARELHNHVLSMGGEPSTSSGAWGGFAKAVEGTAKMLGESMALKALIEGEEHGVHEYEDALASEGVMDEIKAVIRQQLIPRLTEHISTLNQLKDR